MDKQHFDQLVKGVKEMKRHTAGKTVCGAVWAHRLADTAQQGDQRVNGEFAASIPPESVQPRPA